MYNYYYQELKFRLFYSIIHWVFCLGLTFEYRETLIISIKPTSIPYFIITSLSEAVWACFQFCFILSLVICIPIIILQVYIFLRPALYLHEVSRANKVVISVWLFSFFSIVSIIHIIPPLWFITVNDQNSFITPIQLETNLQTYIHFIGYCLSYLLISLIAFIVLVNSGLLGPGRSRRSLYGFAALITCVFSPGSDPAVLLACACTWVLIYESLVFITCVQRAYEGKEFMLSSKPAVNANQPNDRGRKTFQPRSIN